MTSKSSNPFLGKDINLLNKSDLSTFVSLISLLEFNSGFPCGVFSSPYSSNFSKLNLKFEISSVCCLYLWFSIVFLFVFIPSLSFSENLTKTCPRFSIILLKFSKELFTIE